MTLPDDVPLLIADAQETVRESLAVVHDVAESTTLIRATVKRSKALIAASRETLKRFNVANARGLYPVRSQGGRDQAHSAAELRRGNPPRE